MKKGQKLWTRDELILAMNLYCKIPFGTIHQANPKIVHLAKLIGRTPGAISYKLVNLASLDPSLKVRGIKGASNASSLDREIWNEFYGNWDVLPFKSEELLSTLENRTIEELNEIDINDLPKGRTREQAVRARVNQSFFRRSVLASYNSTCCITGLSNPELLIAGHIVAWSSDENNRLNPRNGVVMNALHDKAFERGLITITPDYKIKVSKLLFDKKKVQSVEQLFHQYDGKNIILPSKFLPDPKFLKDHNDNRFKG